MSFLLRHIEEIIRSYKGHPPLALFLKSYFKRHPRLGSRDRKAISEACYLYYRAAKFYPKDDSCLAIIAKSMAWNGTKNTFLEKVFTASYQPAESPNTPDFALAHQELNFSAGIKEQDWLTAQWQQPDLFLRLQNNWKKCLDIIENEGIRYRELPTRMPERFLNLSLPNGSKVDTLLAPEDYIIQDYASQTAAEIATQYRKNNAGKQSVWDVCAGAGGKSLFWKSIYPEDFLLATDVRKTILYNLQKRFRQFGIHGLKTDVMDASRAEEVNQITTLFDFIICDVPCSGSGTWSRTPEQFYFFKKEQLLLFRQIQFPIALHASKKLKPGGILAYITCSVFEEENEKVVNKLLAKNNKLHLIQMQLVNGIAEKADCLFIAILQRED